MCSSGRSQSLPVISIFARVVRQQRIEIARTALLDGRDDLPIDALRVDMRLQRAPARKAVVPGDRELGLVQPGRGVARAQFVELLLGGLLQPVDMRLSRKCLRHDAPSFSAPGVRVSRARKKGMVRSRIDEVGSTLHADRRSPARPG